MKAGRPRKYQKYEALLQSLKAEGERRPRYIHGIGVFRGQRGDVAWLKIRVSHPIQFRGRSVPRGGSIEIKLGNLSSWSWEQLEAQQIKLQGRADRGEALEHIDAPTFKDWSGEWLTGAKDRLRSYSVAEVHIRNQLVPALGNQRLDSIGARDINAWISTRLKVAKPATVKRELSTLGSILSSAVKAGLLEKNCCGDVNAIFGAVGRQRFLRAEEASRLLAAAASLDQEFADLLLWFIHSGMRKSEVLALTKGDVTTFQDGRTVVQISRSKTDEPRIVVCTATMQEIFLRQCDRAPKNPKLFPITPMTLRRRWERVRKIAILEDVTVHDLRRTHATHAAAAGVDLRTLADRIGHTDLSMLQKHYAAVISTSAFDAAAKVEEAIGRLTERKEPTDG